MPQLFGLQPLIRAIHEACVGGAEMNLKINKTLCKSTNDIPSVIDGVFIFSKCNNACSIQCHIHHMLPLNDLISHVSAYKTKY